MRKIIYTLTAMVLFSTLGLAQVKSFDLSKGDVFNINTVMNQTIEQDVMGTPQNIEQTITTLESLEVLDFQDGLYQIKGLTEQIKIEISLPMQGDQVMDSEGEGQMSDVAKALVGKSYVFYMDVYGQIERFEDLDKMSSQIMGDLDKTVLGQMGQSEAMAGFLNEETIKTTLGNLLTIYSTDGSEEWQYNRTATINNLPTEISADRYYDGNNTVMSAGKMSVSGSVEQMGMTVDTEMSGTINMIYDLMSNGMPSKVQVQQEAKGNATVQGMEIPMTVKVNSTSTITKK